MSFYLHITDPANQAFILSRAQMKSSWTMKIFTTTFKSEHSPRDDSINWVQIEQTPIAMKYMQYFYTPICEIGFQPSSPIWCTHTVTGAIRLKRLSSTLVDSASLS